jgi:hypothetical protein
MRVEFSEKIRDLSDEERRMMEDMAIEPKDKRFKWRKIWLFVEDVFAVKEVNEKETILEFNDGSNIIVKGDYATIKGLIEKAEAEREPDLEL